MRITPVSRWSLQGFRGVSSLILDDRNEVETYMYMLTNNYTQGFTSENNKGSLNFLGIRLVPEIYLMISPC